MPAVPVGALHEVVPWERHCPAVLGLPSIRPERGHVVPGTPTENSPSQERMTRIAAMLRDAEQATPVLRRRVGQRPARRSRHAASHRRQASAQIRQCSCIEACRSHSSPQVVQAVAHAWSTARVRFAS